MYKRQGLDGAVDVVWKVAAGTGHDAFAAVDLAGGRNAHALSLIHILHGGAGVVLFDDADHGQVHDLLDLGDVPHGVGTVSYTHLDVYKRQG